MCGIVGIVSKEYVLKDCIKILKKLEYRGYDSAGIVFFPGAEAKLYRSIGHIDILEKKIDFSLDSSLCIAHTRWATHGKATVNNTHPHFSNSRRFYMVHNGTIENYLELKDKYCYDIELYGETDSEILVNCIAYLVEQKKLSVLQSINIINKEMRGSASITLIDSLQPYKIYFSKNQSPLVIGISNDTKYTCSDINAIANLCDSYITLDDLEYGYITADNILVYNSSSALIDKQYKKVEVCEDISYDKEKFDHYMLKEIHEQPQVMKNIVNEYVRNSDFQYDKKVLDSIRTAKDIKLIAAGTSYYACMVAKHILQKLLKANVSVHISSEFAYSNTLLSDKSIYIFFSQSGETADSRVALKKVKRCTKALTIALTNTLNSYLAQKVDYNLPIHAGLEISVASTKAFTSQIATFIGLIMAVSKYDSKYFSRSMYDVAEKMEEILGDKEKYLEISSYLQTKDKVFFMGRQEGYALALEAALKLKEITYIQAEGFASGELKHGSIALIEDGTPVITLISNKKEVADLIRSNVEEVKSRNAKVFVISSEKNSIPEDSIIIPDTNDIFTALLLALPIQLIAYYTAKLKKVNIDMPRNLAKSVTVE